MVKSLLGLLLFTATFFAMTSPSMFAQGGKPVFEQQRYVPQFTATPVRHEAPSEPIPTGWIIAGAAVAVVTVSGLLYAAIKAWRSSSLFERKYHFPPAGSAALRLGGTRCGGFMAAIDPKKEKKEA
jgi:hypothetical protein